MRYIVPLLTAVILIGASVAASLSTERPNEPAPRPNVVVILVDTLRPGYLDVYGYDQETAPFLRQLAKTSTVFDRAVATSSWTAPATASVFTSLYPFQHGVVQGFYAHRDARLKRDMHGDAAAGSAEIPLTAIGEDVPTLPKLFKVAGYATFGVAANRNIDKELGFRQGFDHFFEQNEIPAEQVFAQVESWRHDIAKKPYFLYVHLMDPHYPYGQVSPYFQRYRDAAGDDDKARYLSELRHTDDWIKRFYQYLRLDQNTLLVLLSDHGEEFGDHGSTQHGPTLYEELAHVLMMVHGPAFGVTGRRVAANVSQVDILPTLTEFAEIPTPAGAQGVSLWPLLRGEETGDEPRWAERTLLGHRLTSSPPYQENWSAIRGPWKYIEHVGRDPELYDHRSDPGEKTSVASEHADVAQHLAQAVAAAKASPRGAGQAVQVQIDEQLREQLKSQGYVN